MRKATLALVVIALSASVSLGEVRYTVTDLGTLGGTESFAHAINDHGQVVGTSYIDGDLAYHAFSYDTGVMYDLGTLGGSESRAWDINNSGQVIGFSDLDGDSATNAFSYYDGVMTGFGTLDGTYSSSQAINDNGDIVGYFDEGVFLYDGTTMTDLGVIGAVYSINNSRQLAGSFWYDESRTRRASFYDDSVLTDLGTLGGNNSIAYDINDSGQVVGYSQLAEIAEHAFLYDGTEMIDLGTLGGTNSFAYAINNNGQIVGGSTVTAGFSSRPFLYDDGVMFDLSEMIPLNSGWDLRIANDINSVGQIVGQGYIDGQQHAFLLTPVPETGTMCLFGLGGMLLRRRKA